MRVPNIVKFPVEEPFREPDDVDDDPGYIEKSHKDVVNHGFSKRTRLRPK
jgi:hypothetical protein